MPARALLGWLSDKQAKGALTSHRRDLDLTDEQRRAVEAARAVVAARAKFLDDIADRRALSGGLLTLARYLLPLVPLLLLFVAAGAARLASRVAALVNTGTRIGFAAVHALPVLGLAIDSPLVPMLRHPNAQALNSLYYYDFRPEKNPLIPYKAAIPLSPFWADLGARLPPDSVRIAAAPFYFESNDWDAPRWERLAHQRVLPGSLTGLCVDRRPGELPSDARFRFRNAVHLADDAELARRHIDYVVWQKPYVQTSKGAPEAKGANTANCETALRAKFGAPVFEDSALIAFRVGGAQPAATARAR